jgi:hypothetical protein
MRNTESFCLEGKHSTQQATPCPRKGLFELAEELSEFLLDMPDIDEAQTGLDDMFFGYLCFGDDYDHRAVHDLVWAYKDLQRLLHHARQINEMRQAITIMRNIFRETEKAAAGNPATAITT